MTHPDLPQATGLTMADTQRSQQTRPGRDRGGPVLRAGRPADPPPSAPPAERAAEAAQGPEAVQATAAMPAAEPDAKAPEAEAGTDRPSGQPAPEPEAAARPQAEVEMLQHRRRQLLRQCERVLLLDFDTLAMQGWPDSYQLAQARKRRDLWLFSATLCALVFLSGMTGLVPAWIAGGGFGASVLITLAGVPAIRRLYASRPSHLDLVMKRLRLLREARKHIAHLENDTGLVWQCVAMAEFNPALRSPRFSGLVRLSERRMLASALTRREHIRLCLIFLLEAEKAYGRLEQAYFDGHQRAIDQASAERADAPPARADSTGEPPPG